MSTRKSKDQPAARTRRGSPEAVLKRRAARHFNDLLGASADRAGLDGRTEKKRQRMLEELREGKIRATGRSLKPIDILQRVDALLALGEPIATLKKAIRPPRPVSPTDDVVVGVRRLHDAYGFRVEVYQFVGIDEASLAKAGVVPAARANPDSPGKSGAKPGVARRSPRGAARTKAA